MVVTAKHCATSPETHVPFYYAFHTNTKRVTTGSVPFHFTSLASLSLTLHPSSVSFFSSSPFLLCSIFFLLSFFSCFLSLTLTLSSHPLAHFLVSVVPPPPALLICHCLTAAIFISHATFFHLILSHCLQFLLCLILFLREK